MKSERIFEINGNLGNILNYPNFEATICRVHCRFIELFDEEIMSRIPVYIDNATDIMSGHTPIITPILGKYLCIKLNIDNFLDTQKIIFQFAHELCHYVFYSLKGLDKSFADNYEESVCTAMSLCILKDFIGDITKWVDYVSNLKNIGYRNGAQVAKEIDFNSQQLSRRIIERLCRRGK